LQIRRFHDDHRRGRKVRTRPRQRDHCVDGQGRLTRQQHAKGVVDGDLAVVRRVREDFEVVLGTAALVATLAELVVGQAESRRREQILAVRVVRERAGFTHQRVDHVPIVHRVFIPAQQPWQRIDIFVRVPNLDAVGEQPGLDLLADQATMHRVRVAMNVNQTAAIDPARHLQTRRQPRIGQVPQRRQFLGEALPSTRVPRRHDLL
jgi:hypothetical protein